MSYRRLGEAQQFLESFDWTNDTLRDLESVNIHGTHTVTCGLQVQYYTIHSLYSISRAVPP